MKNLVNDECAKFRGLHVILGLMCLVPSCHHVFVVIFWVQKYFLVVINGAKISFEYLLSPTFFLACISWVQNFNSWVFWGPKFFRCWFKIFSRV